MNEQRQADLLHVYMQALRADLDAIPPRELDAETAVFARKMVRTQLGSPSQAQHRLSRTAKAQMWHDVLRTSADYLSKEENQDMNHTSPLQNHPSESFPFAWVAAILIIVVMSAGALMMRNLTPPDDGLNNIGLAQQTEEAQEADAPTPTPLLMTATPLPVSAIDGVLSTPTPIPLWVLPTAVPHDYAFATTHFPVLTALIDIPAGTEITEEMVVVVFWPRERAPISALRNVAGLYAQEDIPRYLPITDDMLAMTAPTATPTPTPTALPPSDE